MQQLERITSASLKLDRTSWLDWFLCLIEGQASSTKPRYWLAHLARLTSCLQSKRTGRFLEFVLNKTKDCYKSNNCRSTLLSDLNYKWTTQRCFSNNYCALRISEPVNVLRVSTQFRTKSFYKCYNFTTIIHCSFTKGDIYCAIERCFHTCFQIYITSSKWKTVQGASDYTMVKYLLIIRFSSV
jgi:hypothetical protein